eukprot:TRINITY_DN20259_c0_g4_i1.p1 TRINITY_DN20259_c0_g4~~TRINITY_DN20259_c0_g4_i1.p1  ORF type:complete len:1436 (-),score=270.76 TRINITY_DN20259_c0_g4_i1:105-4412(-)
MEEVQEDELALTQESGLSEATLSAVDERIAEVDGSEARLPQLDDPVPNVDNSVSCASPSKTSTASTCGTRRMPLSPFVGRLLSQPPASPSRRPNWRAATGQSQAVTAPSHIDGAVKSSSSSCTSSQLRNSGAGGGSRRRGSFFGLYNAAPSVYAGTAAAISARSQSQDCLAAASASTSTTPRSPRSQRSTHSSQSSCRRTTSMPPSERMPLYFGTWKHQWPTDIGEVDFESPPPSAHPSVPAIGSRKDLESQTSESSEQPRRVPSSIRRGSYFGLYNKVEIGTKEELRVEDEPLRRGTPASVRRGTFFGTYKPTSPTSEPALELDAKALLEKSLESVHALRERLSQGIIPEASEYHRAILDAEAAEQWRVVVHLYREMPAGGVPADETCVSAALRAAAGGLQDATVALTILAQTLEEGVRPAAAAVAEVLHVLRRSGADTLSPAIVDLILRCGPSLDSSAREAAMLVLEHAKQWRAAAWFFDSVCAAGLGVGANEIQVACRALARSGRSEQALELLRDLRRRGARAEPRSLGAAIGACVRAGSRGAAEELIREAARVRDNSVAEVAIETLCADVSDAESGLWKSALGLLCAFDAVNVPLSSQVVQRSIDRACAPSDAWEAALRILGLQTPVPVPIAEAEITALPAGGGDGAAGAALRVCAGAGRWEQALDLLRHVEAVGDLGSPSVESYEKCLTCCQSSQKWEIALDLLQDMRERELPLKRDCRAAAAAACAEGRQWQAALSLLPGPPADAKESVDLGVYSDIILACERAGQPQKALDTYNAMLKANVGVSASACEAALRACGGLGDWRAAIVILATLSSSRSAASTSEACSTSRTDRPSPQPLDLAALIRRDGGASVDAHVMHTAAKNCAAIGYVDDAVELLVASHMLTPSMALSAEPETQAIFEDVFLACGRTCRWEACIRLLQSRGDVRLGDNVEVWRLALRACEEESVGPLALQILDEMKARGIPRGTEDVKAAAAACSRSDQWPRALELLEAVAAEAFASGKSFGAGFHGLEFELCARAQNWQSALWLLWQLQGRGEADETSYSQAGAVCESAGRWQEACALLHQVHQRGQAGAQERYAGAMRLCEAHGAWKEAHALLCDLRCRGHVADADCYHGAIATCARQGQWKCAVELLDDMLNARGEPSVATYTAAMDACAKAGQWQRALELLARVKASGQEPTAAVYGAAIAACDRGLQWQRALQLVDEMQKGASINPTPAILRAGIRATERGRQWERACALLRDLLALRSASLSAPSSPTSPTAPASPTACATTAGPSAMAAAVTSAVRACERAGQWQSALVLLRETRAYGVAPEPAAYNAAAAACQRSHQWQVAIDVLKEVREQQTHGRSPQAHSPRSTGGSMRRGSYFGLYGPMAPSKDSSAPSSPDATPSTTSCRRGFSASPTRSLRTASSLSSMGTVSSTRCSGLPARR